MQFLRILLLPLLSILLVIESHALEDLANHALDVSSSVKNNAKAPVNIYKNGIYSHTIGKGLPGTPISMENIDTPTGGQHIPAPQDLRRWMVDKMRPPTNSHKRHRARRQSAENRSIFHLCKRKRPISARVQGAEAHRIRAYYLYVRIPSTGGNEATWMLCGLLHQMAESRSSLTERNKQMVMEGGDHLYMGGLGLLYNKLVDGELVPLVQWDPATFQEVLLTSTRIGSYFIHPIFGITYNALLDKKMPVWDDGKLAYQELGKRHYGSAAYHAGMAAWDAAAIGKAGKALWIGVKRCGGFGNQLNNTPIKIKPSGLGSTGRTIPKNLNEQLAMKEVMADPQAIGKYCENIGPLKDNRWKGWFKMRNKNSNGVEIHFNAKWEGDKIVAVDDFKFIDP